MPNGFSRLVPGGDPAKGMQPSDLIALESFTTEDKTEMSYEYYISADEETMAGVWECAPCFHVFDAYPFNELITLISGSVTLTDENGDSDTYTAGDTYFVEKGKKVTWEITEYLKKFYMLAP